MNELAQAHQIQNRRRGLGNAPFCPVVADFFDGDSDGRRGLVGFSIWFWTALNSIR